MPGKSILLQKNVEWAVPTSLSCTIKPQGGPAERIRPEGRKNKVTGNGRTNHLAAKHFQIMLYIHTIGRIGKDCQVIEGTHGSFIAFDMAVDDFSHGNTVTTWVRVRSNRENHIRLSEYLTKGRMVLVGGTLSTSLWKDKNGESQIQLSITADALEFINTGKREGTTSEADGQPVAADNAPVPSTDRPQDGEEDLPF